MKAYKIVYSWVNLIDALIYVLTLGTWRPGWDMKFIIWYRKRELRMKIKGDLTKFNGRM